MLRSAARPAQRSRTIAQRSRTIPRLSALLLAASLCILPAGSVSATTPAAAAPKHFNVTQTDIPPHPRLVLNRAELLAIGEAIKQGSQPQTAAWQRLRESLAKAPAPQAYTGTDLLTLYNRLSAQSGAARDFALSWWLTGNEADAAKAIDYIRVWSTAEPTPGSELYTRDGSPNTAGNGMYLARAAFAMIYAADLLWDSPQFDTSTKDAFTLWLRAIEAEIHRSIRIWEDNDYLNRQYYQNHLVAHSLGLAAIGSLLGDRELLQFSLDHSGNPRDFVELIEGMILMEGKAPHHRERRDAPAPQDGEIADRYRQHTARGRGLQYVHLSLSLLAVGAEVYRPWGVDLWQYTAKGGENLELPFTFYADFYRLGDTSLKGGFYSGTDHRIGRAGDTTAIFEVGLRRYPDNADLQNLIGSTQRADTQDALLGRTALTHAKPHTTRPAPSEAPQPDSVTGGSD